MEKICTVISLFLVTICTQIGDARELKVRHAVGGLPSALELQGDYWYQSLGDKLLVLNRQGNGQLETRMLTPYPASASCSDLLVHANVLYALLDGSEVVTFTLTVDQAPKIINRQSADSLGIIPLELVMVGDWPIAIGEGGAVRLTDGKQLVSTEGNMTGIAMSIGRGLVFAMDGDLIDAGTAERIGAATTLVELDDDANADIGTLAYTLDVENGTEVGLLGSGLLGTSSSTGKVILEGEFQHVLSRKSRLIVSTDEAVYVLGISPDELRVLRTFDLQGVQEIDVIASNYLAMCGEFGRGVFRIEDDRGGSGGKLFRVTPSNGELRADAFDLRGVSIPATYGSLYYSFDQKATPRETWVETVEPPIEAVVLGMVAIIQEDSNGNSSVAIVDSRGESILPLPSPATTIVAIEGNFWVGTQNGVHVFSRNATGECVEIGSIKLAGPIVQLIPLFDGSAAFVSEAGMVGIIEQTQSVVALEQ